ncbi:MAG: hypothetical protein ACFFDH_01110 [Promethearchaeota archaeon]
MYALYKSRKTRLNNLLYLGIVFICIGLVYTGDILDFFTILLTESNIDNSFGIIGFINWMWFPGVSIFAMYLGAELIIPKK